MTTKKIVFCGIIAALYAVLTVALAPISYGAIQFRVSEALCILCFFSPVATVGLTVGCFIANIFSTVSVLDLVFGTAATLIGCYIASKIRNRWLFPLPIILANAILVGIEIALVATPDAILTGTLLFGAEVGFGELVVLYVLGIPLIYALEHTKIKDTLAALR